MASFWAFFTESDCHFALSCNKNSDIFKLVKICVEVVHIEVLNA